MRAAAVVAVLALGLAAAQTAAGKQPVVAGERPTMLVVDLSSSMDEDDGNGTRKIDGAKAALLDYVGTVDPSQSIGLRTYPDPAKGSCNAGRRAIDIGPADPGTMSATIRGLKAEGDTPTALALQSAATDLKDAGGTGGTIVIVSDGESNCDADPCEVAKKLAGEGFNLDAITVGFRISDEGRKELQCISNALDGRYIDITESQQLQDILDSVGRPRMKVEIVGATRIPADAGGKAVQVKARVTNTGQAIARDAIAGITADKSGVDIRRPVLRLGNLAPKASTTVTWSVRADVSAVGTEVPLTVVGRAINSSVAGQTHATLVIGGVTPDKVGAVLKGPGSGVIILGDSFSAGEGTDVYEEPTDTHENGCHRSPLTYLIPALRERVGGLTACSGALIADLFAPNQGNKLPQPDPSQGGKVRLLPEPGQGDQLEALQKKRQKAAQAIVMTIGGNDAGFGKLAKSCIAGPESCTKTIYTGLPTNLDHEPTADFVMRNIGAPALLGRSLISAYGNVNRALNNEKMVKLRGGHVAPILVLGYVLPVPQKGRTCAPMGTYTVTLSAGRASTVKTMYLLSSQEIDFIADFAARLNATVEAAVETARREDGVPVFFVPDTESAFQPNHTVCDGTPFARATNSFNGGEWNAKNIIDLVNPSIDPWSIIRKFNAAKDVSMRGAQELAHPNVKGYAAETQAILRWSADADAGAAVDFTKTAKPAGPVPTSWAQSDAVLGPSSGDAGTLQPGTIYPLQGDGFAPGSSTQLTVHSTPQLLAEPRAKATGNIDTAVAIPRDLAGGDHELRLVGRDPQGRPRTVAIRFNVDKPFRPGVLPSLLVAAALLLLLGGGLAMATGSIAEMRRTRAATNMRR